MEQENSKSNNAILESDKAKSLIAITKEIVRKRGMQSLIKTEHEFPSRVMRRFHVISREAGSAFFS